MRATTLSERATTAAFKRAYASLSKKARRDRGRGGGRGKARQNGEGEVAITHNSYQHYQGWTAGKYAPLPASSRYTYGHVIAIELVHVLIIVRTLTGPFERHRNQELGNGNSED